MTKSKETASGSAVPNSAADPCPALRLDHASRYTKDRKLPYDLITLRCSDGFSVSLCSLGASIRQILAPGRDGQAKNIVLSFADDEAYLDNGLYAGATLAPTAGRISQGILPLPGGESAALAKNENGIHTLHGGFQNASFRNWTLQSLSCDGSCARVVFTLTLPHGLDGFPGNRTLSAAYTLEVLPRPKTEAPPLCEGAEIPGAPADRTQNRASCGAAPKHRLTAAYRAVSDRDTYFNLSNHTYFNLTGDFSRPALDHVLSVRADRYIENRPDFIPLGSAPVEGTPFDFRRPVSPASQCGRFPRNEQLAQNQGFNHGFILNPDPEKPSLTCTHPDSPLHLEVSTDAPCMVFYSGGYIPKGLALNPAPCGSVPSCALAFEFQDYPDAPGGHGFPYHPTPAHTDWSRTIRYSFL